MATKNKDPYASSAPSIPKEQLRKESQYGDLPQGPPPTQPTPEPPRYTSPGTTAPSKEQTKSKKSEGAYRPPSGGGAPEYTEIVSESGKEKTIAPVHGKQEGIQKAYFDPSQQMKQYGEGAPQTKQDIQTLMKDPFAFLIVKRSSGKTEVLRGGRAVGTLLQQREQQLQAQKLATELFQKGTEAQREWHPGTKVVQTKEGFTAKFPYPGAQHYGTYKGIVETHPELPALRALASPTLNVDLAMAKPGQERTDIMVKWVHGIRGSPEGGLDLGRGASTVLESPWVQIALAAAGGYGIGKVAKSGYQMFAASKFGGSMVARRAIQIASASAGAALTAPRVHNIYQDIEKGELGSAIGKGVTLTATVASGYTGFKAGFKGAVPPKGVKWERPGVPVRRGVRVEATSAKGTPLEKEVLKVYELMEYKPGKPRLILDAGTSKTPSLSMKGATVAQVRGGKITTTGTKPLFSTKTMQVATLRSGTKSSLFGLKQRAYVMKYGEASFLRQPTIKEAGGFGGLMQQKQVLAPQLQFGGKTVTPSFSFKPMVQPVFGTLPKIESISQVTPSFEIKTDQQKAVSPVMQSLLRPTGVKSNIMQGTLLEDSTKVGKTTSFKTGDIENVGFASTSKTEQTTSTPTIPIFQKLISIKPGVFFPSEDVHGRGSLFGGSKLFGKTFKFRKVKVKSPLRGLKL